MLLCRDIAHLIFQKHLELTKGAVSKASLPSNRTGTAASTSSFSTKVRVVRHGDSVNGQPGTELNASDFAKRAVAVALEEEPVFAADSLPIVGIPKPEPLPV